MYTGKTTVIYFLEFQNVKTLVPSKVTEDSDLRLLINTRRPSEAVPGSEEGKHYQGFSLE